MQHRIVQISDTTKISGHSLHIGMQGSTEHMQACVELCGIVIETVLAGHIQVTL